MPATDVLMQLRSLGVRVTVAGDKLSLEPASRIPPEMLAAVRECKAELLRLLAPSPKPPASATPREHADAVEEMCQLGARLKRGEIAAVRCGLSGRVCRNCQGVPCLGSTPWAEAAIPPQPDAGGGQEPGRASNAN